MKTSFLGLLMSAIYIQQFQSCRYLLLWNTFLIFFFKENEHFYFYIFFDSIKSFSLYQKMHLGLEMKIEYANQNKACGNPASGFPLKLLLLFDPVSSS